MTPLHIYASGIAGSKTYRFIYNQALMSKSYGASHEKLLGELNETPILKMSNDTMDRKYNVGKKYPAITPDKKDLDEGSTVSRL